MGECPVCGTENHDLFTACSRCGATLTGKVCKSCGSPLAPAARFCGVCGKSAPTRPVAGRTLDPANPQRPPEFVGRIGELGRLLQAAERMLSGRGGCSLVTGPPGIGKTALLDVLCAELGRYHIVTLRAGFSPETAGVAFSGWTPILERVFNIYPNDTVKEVTYNVENLTGSRYPECNPALVKGMLLPLQSVERDQPLPQTMAEAAHTLSTLTGLYMGNAAKAIVLDDLQWADRPSLQAARALARAAVSRRIALFIAVRPEQLPLLDGIEAERIDLDELAGDDRVQLIEKLSRGGIAQAAVRELFDGVPGNPLLLTHLFEYAVDRHFILREAGQWRLNASRSGSLAAGNVASLMKARFLGLPEHIREFLKALVTFSVEAEFSNIREIYRFSDFIEEDILYLRKKNLVIEQQDRSGNRMIAVRETSLFEAIREVVPPDERSGLASAASTAILATRWTRRTYLSETIANLLLLETAPRRLDRLYALERFGDGLAVGFNLELAGRFYRLAAELLERRAAEEGIRPDLLDFKLASLLEKRLALQDDGGPVPDDAPALMATLKKVALRNDFTRHYAACLMAEAQAARTEGRLKGFVDPLKRAMLKAQQAEDDMLLSRLSAMAGEALLDLGHLREAREALLYSLSLLERRQRFVPQGRLDPDRLLLLLAEAYRKEGEHDGALAFLMRAIEQLHERPGSLMAVVERIAQIYLDRREWTSAGVWAEKGLELARQHGSVRMAAVLAARMATVHLNQGRVEDAVLWYRDSLDGARAVEWHAGAELAAQALARLSPGAAPA